MADYDRTDRGALFKNDRKESERHPDYKGSINVGGAEYWLSAWIKEGKKGKFMSLSVEPKQAKPAQNDYAKQSQASMKSQAPAGFDESDIPFACHGSGASWRCI